ncbi:putative tricarboxylic transport membrane protein [Promicromonospora umidemergens]|uniref:Tripartite tricarboxylate transporter substrate-binding protein n=1 Tax=Promicromonospora umidemergens TaxID=629679 RepID=A0ABP8WKE6_9MICO|nr:tripartite tricarboxylate transporter substrate-binding protein [Promicromonospora umidemergens]MCP2283793.1 putative tricarboxylic transport membrane protein [Promicromonospora umidemergens]
MPPPATQDEGRTAPSEKRGRRLAGPLPYVVAAVLAVVLVVVTVVRGGAADVTNEALGDQQLKIMAPADPGGGWDQTSRAMQASLKELAGRTEVYNVGGAGGTIGLSQFAQLDGQSHQLMTTGLIMVGAIAANGSANTLDEVTPLARLTTDSQVIVVPAESDIMTMEDLADRMRDQLSSVSFAGGSAGGAEQILAGLVAKDLELNPGDVNYIAHSGGGEAVATLLSGSAVAGISGISEIKAQIDAGQMRALAVSSAERVGVLPDVPTLRESDIDVELTNWRGVVAPAGITTEQEQALESLVMAMTETDEWQETLAREGWGDVALAGPQFETFLDDEIVRTTQIVDELGLSEEQR